MLTYAPSRASGVAADAHQPLGPRASLKLTISAGEDAGEPAPENLARGARAKSSFLVCRVNSSALMRADACRAPSRATPPLAGASLALFRRPVFAGDPPNADEIRERSVCCAHELLRRPRPRRLAGVRGPRLERLNLSPSHQGVRAAP